MSASSHADCKRRVLADNREMSRLKAAAGLTYPDQRVNAAVAAARMAEIPVDTRNLTQRINGDPIFERSAAAKCLQNNEKPRRMTLPWVTILHGAMR